MIQFGLLRLRSALSAGDKTLKAEEKEYLRLIDPRGEMSFLPPKADLPVVFFIQTGGSEIYFKDCYESFPEPYVLLVQGKRNSLAAALEIKAFLNAKKKRCLLLMGEPSSIYDQLARYHKFFYAAKKLSTSKLGVIGRPSDWLIASSYQAKHVKSALGVTMVSVPMKEFLELVDGRILADTKAFKRFIEKTARRESLRKSLYVHGALDTIVKRYGLSGFTLRCFDLVQSRQETSCLALAMFNEKGIVAGCEGDVPSLLTMYLIKALLDLPSFMANPAEIDVKENKAIYAHCTCPLSMLSSYTLATHFESGLGFGIRGVFPTGKMTAVKLSPDLSKIRAIPCQLLDNPVRPDLCRSQISVKFDGDIAPLIDDPYGNHMIFVQGDVQEEVTAFFDYLRII